MGYFLRHVVRDRLVWTLIGVVVVGTINAADMLSYGLAYPGLFNLWAVRITAIVAAAGAAGYGIYLYHREKSQKNFDREWPPFSVARKEFITEQLAIDPNFQTFCFQCGHFDPQRLACGLSLPRVTIWIKLDRDRPHSHCLLWNASEIPGVRS